MERVVDRSRLPLIRSMQANRAKRMAEEESKMAAEAESKAKADAQAAESFAAQAQARAARQAAVESAAATLWGKTRARVDVVATASVNTSKHATASTNTLPVPTGRKKVVKKRKKGAPAEVSNRRACAPPSSIAGISTKKRHEPRDPRFDDLSGSLNVELFQKSYSFLDDYRASELEGMRKQVSELREREDQRSRNEVTGIEAAIKRQVQEDKQRTRLGELRDEELATKREEREKVRTTGKVPFFHKLGAVRKQLTEKRKQTKKGSGSRKPDERRERKEAAREKKKLPRQRR